MTEQQKGFLKFQVNSVMDELLNFDLETIEDMEAEEVGTRVILSEEGYKLVDDDFIKEIQEIMSVCKIAVRETYFDEPCLDYIISAVDLKFLQEEMKETMSLILSEEE